MLEGSIRKAGNRVRVTGQLIDALNGSQIWAERYDRILEDIFAVQEELTQASCGHRAADPRVRDRQDPPPPPEASAPTKSPYGQRQGLGFLVKTDCTRRDAAIADAGAALAIDPRSTTALGALAFAQWQHLAFATAADRSAAWREGMAAADLAIEIDRAFASRTASRGCCGPSPPIATASTRRWPGARRSYALNPHSMAALTALSFIETVSGDPGERHPAPAGGAAPSARAIRSGRPCC